MPENTPKVLLRITDLKQYFPLKKTTFRGPSRYVKANDGITLDIYQGETFGLVGESGCGKSTFGRVLLQLYRQTAGRTLYYGRRLDELAPGYVGRQLRGMEDQEKQGKGRVSPEEAARFIGGFAVGGDAAKAREAYLKLYQTAEQGRRIRIEREKLELKRGCLKAKPGGEARAARLEDALRAKRSEEAGNLQLQQECTGQIQTLREPNLENARFMEYEAMRDVGIDLAMLSDEEMRVLRRDLQLIFQDPYSSLNPRMTAGQIIGEGLLAHRVFAKNDPRMQDYVKQVMEECGLASYLVHRYPHQFSGGQRQRIGIARSLAMKPKFVVCDEAVSALDVSIQSQIVNLLGDLKEKEKLTYLFISHDLSVVKYISDRIGVMYLGGLAELSPTAEIFENPLHPYTEALLSAIPTTDPTAQKKALLLEGDIPSPVDPPSGCKFHTRCRYCTDVCRQETPAFSEASPGHFVACHHPLGG